MVRSAYFIIADITGYTYFLTRSELDHAQEILKALFQVVLDNIKPPIAISNFQGDAVLSYAPTAAFADGSHLLDAVERIYCAFAGLLETMKINTTCTCKACVNMEQLDLKFFVHHGEYGMQELHGRQELSGLEVILVHRLMKNEVVEKTQVRAYTLITRQAIQALRLEQAAAEMIPHSESYEHIGKVDCFVHDLQQVWQRAKERRQVKLDEKEIAYTATVDIPLPQALAWQFVTRPDIKEIFYGSERVSITKRAAGRTGVGTQYHCVHGKQYVDQFILEWRPFEYFTLREEIHLGLLHPVLTSYYTLSPANTGTRLEVTMSRPKTSNPVKNMLVQIVWDLMVKPSMRKKHGVQLAAKFEERIKADKKAGVLADAPESPVTDREITRSVQHKLKTASSS